MVKRVSKTIRQFYFQIIRVNLTVREPEFVNLCNYIVHVPPQVYVHAGSQFALSALCVKWSKRWYAHQRRCRRLEKVATVAFQQDAQALPPTLAKLAGTSH
jgi:hypothetical protein